MILLLHIVIALASMAYAAYVYISPSKSKLSIAYGLAATTLATGVFLLVQNPAHMVQACIVGLVYFGVVGVAVAAARRKLVSAE